MVALDRVVATVLALGSMTLPFLRYGATSFADLRSASAVLGPPVLTGPPVRQVESVLGLAVGLCACAWLASEGQAGPSRDEFWSVMATRAARPAALVAGLGAIILTAAYLGSALTFSSSTIGRLLLWIGGTAALAAAQEPLGRVLRRLPEPGLGAAVGAVLLAGAAAGLGA